MPWSYAGRTSLDLKKRKCHLLLERPNIGGEVGPAFCCSPPEAFFAKLSHVINTCQTYTKALLTLRTWSKAGLRLGLPAALSVSLPGATVVSPLVVFQRGHDGVRAGAVQTAVQPYSPTDGHSLPWNMLLVLQKLLNLLGQARLATASPTA